ncbi:MAG TPA: antibiotic biosynthesis monooxygenase [Alphaproteobacteria bacterium]|nr:antibiotic biosynthesis monooxygenase [Alphaproteobacteria bacterium]
MIVVIFEVLPNDGRASEYFDLAKALAPELAKIDGFISVERFESLTSKGKVLSLSTWRDEAAVKAWYGHLGHRAAQAKGKAGIFKDFRIRVASVLRDYDMASRLSAGAPSAAE